ncbi:nucleotidyl transferase AbiEii/AbiGii toxin family protein [Ensifer canadensis]
MRQVDLLVRTLPFIARHEAFALKGGTAINLFYRNMPRLSVDIDLTYLPIEDRETTLKEIDTILEHIREDLLRNLRGATVQRIAGGGNNVLAQKVTSLAAHNLAVADLSRVANAQASEKPNGASVLR